MKQLCKYIDARGGETFITDRISAGESVGTICKSIKLPGEAQPISRPFLYTWRNKGGDERRRGWALAMKVSADAIAEEAGDILDELAVEHDPSSAQVALARSRSEYRRWLAKTRDRDKYGEDRQAAVNVNLNIADLHFASLRELGQRPAPMEIIDAEVIKELPSA